jgi:LPXTG-motif cell wall-anchored protein
MQDGEQPETPGLTRRDALRRAAAVGGALVWTVPVVQSMSGTAVAAQGSVEVEGTKIPHEEKPKPDTEVEGSKLPHTGSVAGDVAALGVGALAVGAATRAVKKRREATAGIPTDPPTPHGRHRSA